MMKKIIAIAVAILLTSITAQSQNPLPHELSIGIGGGLSGLQYNPSIGQKSLGLGGNAGLGYSYFFSEHFGIGTGVEYSFYHSKLKNGAFNNVINNITDPSDGEIYDFHSKMSNFSDNQKAAYLNIPLMLQYRHGSGFYAAAGARIGIPLSGKSESTATFENRGYFHATHNWASTQTFMGFGTFTDMKQEEDMELKTAFMLSLEGGWKWSLSRKVSLYTGAYLDYGLNHIIDSDTRNFVTHTATPTGASFVHHGALPSNYTDGNVTTSIAKKVAPISLGLKLSLSLGLGKTEWWHHTQPKFYPWKKSR